MAKKLIPFPQLDPAAEPEPIVKHHGGIVIRLGSKRYAIDITASARPLRRNQQRSKCFPGDPAARVSVPGKGTLRGPGMFAWDMGAFKKIPLGQWATQRLCVR